MVITVFWTPLPFGITLGEPLAHDIVQMIVHAGLMVKFVLLILLLFSVVCWAIILTKLSLFHRVKRETNEFLDVFWETKELKKIQDACEDLGYSPVARLFKAGYEELTRILRIQGVVSAQDEKETTNPTESQTSQQAIKDHVQRSLEKETVNQVKALGKTISFLATTANTAPFIGLFGTVWGIMESFRGIGLRGSANLAVVAPGISEALIATAAGLAAAIPAVVAFNHFSHKVEAIRAEMDMFASDFLGMMERQFLRKQKPAKRSP